MPEQSDEIFRLEDDRLISIPSRSMREGLFGKTLEEAIQTIFEKHPQIIPGKQIDPSSDDPPRFVLLRREMPLGSLSLDHLYVDQRGILTLVETKLFQNPESRREVIGQIIEYAANALEYCANGKARRKATEYWINKSLDLDDILPKEFDEELDIEAFWNTVEENLKNGRIRLIIAADEIRPEVRRMIEYLNREMQNAEVLGLELKVYGKDPDSLVLVPRLVGQTQSNIDKKSLSKKSITWTTERLEKAFSILKNQDLATKLQKILNWAVDKKVFKISVAMSPAFGIVSKTQERIISFYSEGTIYVILNEKFFWGGFEERNNLVKELKELSLLNKDLDPKLVVSGRNLNKKLFELNDEEIDKLLDVFSKYCI